MENINDSVLNYIMIGQRIQIYRKKKGLKQATLAEMVGISDKYLSRLELGYHKAQFDIYYKIAKALEIPLDALIEDQVEPKSEAYIQLIRQNIKNFSDKQMVMLKEFTDLVKKSDFWKSLFYFS